MKRMPAREHANRVASKNWVGFEFPRTKFMLPRPWFKDGDKRFLTKPSKKHPDSDRIMAHVKKTGQLNINTGDTVPDYAGKTEGVFVNVATDKDPVYTISDKAHRKNLWVQTGASSNLYGKTVRIPDDAIAQGYPMEYYSDSKVTIVDTSDSNPQNWVVTEIQFMEDVTINPLKMFFLSIFGIRPGYACHGVTQYSFSEASTQVKGSSAAKIPVMPAQLRYPDIATGWGIMSTCGVPAAHKTKFIPPALGTDGQSVDPNAIQMGMLLKLKPEAIERLNKKYKVGYQAAYALSSWHDYGIMVVDTSAHVAFGWEPDPRLDQAELSILKTLTLDDFEVWVP